MVFHTKRTKGAPHTYEGVGVLKDDQDAPLQSIVPKVVKGVLKSERNIGIMSCGTGIGVQIGANRFRGIRAQLATNPQIARWSKIYDKSNVLCLVGWNIKKSRVYKILDAWFDASYDGSKKRLIMFKEFDKWH